MSDKYLATTDVTTNADWSQVTLRFPKALTLELTLNPARNALQSTAALETGSPVHPDCHGNIILFSGAPGGAAILQPQEGVSVREFPEKPGHTADNLQAFRPGWYRCPRCAGRWPTLAQAQAAACQVEPQVTPIGNVFQADQVSSQFAAGLQEQLNAWRRMDKPVILLH